MVLTNLEIKLEQTDSAINYFLKYLLFADDHTPCFQRLKNKPCSRGPFGAASDDNRTHC